MLEALFITTNTGSIELRNAPCTTWINSLKEAILECPAEFVAVHIQESNEQAIKELHRDLCLSTPSCRNRAPRYDQNKRIFAFLHSDDQFSGFTGLGALYLFRSDEKQLEIWDYKESRFFPVPANKNVQTSGSWCTGVTSNTSFEKDRLKNCVDWKQFPAALFPSGIPSRKGFMRTRWRINGLILETVNIHLFNDSCNLRSLKEHPSVFARFRSAGLKWTLEAIRENSCENQHLAVFGDFNFRLNLPLYIERLLSAHDLPYDHSTYSVQDSAKSIDRAEGGTFNRGDIVIGRRQFHIPYDDRLTWSNFEPFLPLDQETLAFSGQLQELPITFPPSYPFSYEAGVPHDYDATRCPVWCDRIMFSVRTFSCLRPPDHHCSILYDLLGKDVALGDHKPVYVHCRLEPN